MEPSERIRMLLEAREEAEATCKMLLEQATWLLARSDDDEVVTESDLLHYMVDSLNLEDAV